MALAAEEFAQGRWVGDLKGLLPSRLIPDWQAVSRLTRGNWIQWLQYEPKDLVGGPKFFMAKPGVVAFDGEILYAGLYVERGRDLEFATPREREAGEVLSPEWHWYGLVRLWQTAEGRAVFHEKVARLSAPVVVSQHHRGDDVVRHEPWRATTPAVYEQVLREMETVHGARWIDLVVGIGVSRVAWNEDPRGVAEECRSPLIAAFELHNLIAQEVAQSVDGDSSL